jgi:hypothetical protein
MPATYEKIATTTLGSSGTITFNSIPASWTDLRLVIVPIGATGDLSVVFNSDTGSNYSLTLIAGTGTSAVSDRYVSQTRLVLTGWNTMSSTVPDMRTADIFSYAGSTYKTVLTTETVDRNGSGSTARGVGLWQSTSAITSIALSATGTAFQSGTIATLYGILKA